MEPNEGPFYPCRLGDKRELGEEEEFAVVTILIAHGSHQEDPRNKARKISLR